MMPQKGSMRPCMAFPRLEDSDYQSSAARATRRPGACLVGDCGFPATHDGLCVRHDALYRLRCVCGRILTDAAVERGFCSECYRSKGPGKERRQAMKNANRRARRNK